MNRLELKIPAKFKYTRWYQDRTIYHVFSYNTKIDKAYYELCVKRKLNKEEQEQHDLHVKECGKHYCGTCNADHAWDVIKTFDNYKEAQQLGIKLELEGLNQRRKIKNN